MDVLGSGGIGLGDCYFLEIMHIYLQIAAQDLNVYDDLLVFSARQSVPVVLIRLQRVRKRLILRQFNFCVLGLHMQINFGRLV